MHTVMMTLTLNDISALKGALRLAEENRMDARSEWHRRSLMDSLSVDEYEQAVTMVEVCDREWERVSDLLCEVERLEDALYDKMAGVK